MEHGQPRHVCPRASGRAVILAWSDADLVVIVAGVFLAGAIGFFVGRAW